MTFPNSEQPALGKLDGACARNFWEKQKRVTVFSAADAMAYADDAGCEARRA